MIARIILLFVMLATVSSVVIYAASCTKFFDAARLCRIARNAAIAAGGGVIAFFIVAALVAINA